MTKIAPSLCRVVGPVVAARLMEAAGSFRNLSRAPASTVQILGAEASLFRAQREQQPTPKYGCIFCCERIQKQGLDDGRAARQVACKAALAVRADYFGREGKVYDFEIKNLVQEKLLEYKKRIEAEFMEVSIKKQKMRPRKIEQE